MRRAIVDVDGTLWDFHRPLHKYLHDKFGTPSELASKWDWFEDAGLTKSQFYQGVMAIHNEQMYHAPFPGAHHLFRALRDCKFQVIVASHRNHTHGARLAAWLAKYRLGPYAGVYCGPDKKFLIDKDGVLIDDAPATIQYATRLGATCLTLAWPWNENEAALRFDFLTGIAAFIRRNYGG
jgi:phosphoglycolate phosphatase-like HAD superfamily hydrolase